MLERVDKKIAKNEMLMTSQLLSTNHTSHSSSSHKTHGGGDEGGLSNSKTSSISNRQGHMSNTSARFNNHSSRQSPHLTQQVLNHLVTFEAHTNSIFGLQANNMSENQFASLGKDNSVKVWSVTT